jgi:hypothetical protein
LSVAYQRERIWPIDGIWICSTMVLLPSTNTSIPILHRARISSVRKCHHAYRNSSLGKLFTAAIVFYMHSPKLLSKHATSGPGILMGIICYGFMALFWEERRSSGEDDCANVTDTLQVRRSSPDIGCLECARRYFLNGWRFSR